MSSIDLHTSTISVNQHITQAATYESRAEAVASKAK
jgi:hypothetical protein